MAISMNLAAFPFAGARARLRAGSWQRWIEAALLAALAFQCAALIWALLVPVGAIGAWEPQMRQPAAPALSVLRETDPFFPTGARGGTIVVTSLNLSLHGVRQDQGSSRGSAIIATPDGVQHSFGVGEEVVHGVTLAAVGFDNITLLRNGVREQLFMDQSGPAKVVGAPPAPATGTAPLPPAAPASAPPVRP
ncbi:type II secretion system protein N [Sphingosinicella sp. BN140058]|uniref:type II secretion system protein N n=1 Tax=Sphingosinicella sp. BN140058 TaxID=1892855 RepID=UPI001013100C|nr:type II secretion system protein N [Sphingosinicella sp. BN140058]QAY78542.1 hypothetical protein ETR14_19850 [Sphingosinicella sp. BN140058]